MPRSLRLYERETRAARSSVRVRAPCPRDGGHTLRALAMGACALILLVVPATAQSQSNADLSAQLTRHLSTMKKDQQVLRFLDKHRWLLSDPRFEADAKRQLRLHTLSLAHTKKMAAQAKRALAARAKVQAKVRHLAAVEAAKPENVICQRVRPALRGGPRGLALRVRPVDVSAKRPVSRALPDGLERTAPLRSRPFGPRAGEGGLQVLRRLRSWLEPLVVQALELTALSNVSCAKCGTRVAGRVPSPRTAW